MTAFSNCAVTDLLRQHDTYRLTIVPGSHVLQFAEPDVIKSAELSYGMAAIFAAGGIGNVIPLFTNPYKDGDLADTIDVLVMSDGGSVADMINGILDVANDPEFADVEISNCEQVVGQTSNAPGTDAANNAVYSPQAAATRASDAAAAGAAAGNDWLSKLESEVGTVGTYALVGVSLLGALWAYQQAKRIRRIA